MRLATTRRDFLKATALGAAGLLTGATAGAGRPRRPRVAAVYTVCYHRSHAHVILENFFHRYLFNGQVTDPGVDVVALYTDQRRPDDDLTAAISRRYEVPVFGTIADALTLGTGTLAVDAVLAIGEHGEYPFNDFGQQLYPRKRFFDESVAVMRRSGRYVPYFNDKYLSHDWGEAAAMYDTALELGIPFLAGSSVPLAQRRPPLEVAPGTPMAEAVAVHGGPAERYGFHGLEILQSMVEFRSSRRRVPACGPATAHDDCGETGVESVELWEGEELFRAARQGKWDAGLAEQAMRAELGDRYQSLTRVPGEPETVPHGIHVRYADGFKATVLKVGQSGTRWNFAYKPPGGGDARTTTWYVGPWQNRNLFKALSHAIQHLFVHRHAPYPVERTLLTTGILDAAMHSKAAGGRAVRTPHLEFAYVPRDFHAMRELGDSWRIITEQTREPHGFAEVGIGE